MAKITFLGSCREVGRSAILIESKNGDQCILDYGIRFREEERLPYKTDLTRLKGVALTHCHVDHSGALPFLYKNKNPPFFTNPVTLEIIDKLIQDTLKVSKYPYPFGINELNNLKRNAHFLVLGQKQRIADNFFLTFYDAGHVPGSVSIVVEVDGKKILYTGDINTKNTNLVKSANPDQIPEVDAVILESTYALRTHPPREELEKQFVEETIDVIENGGNVLVPAFGVARSQEAILILNRLRYRGKLFVDGMAKLISKIYFDYPESLKNKNQYRDALRRAKFINRRRKRSIKGKSNSVIVSPSGMLKGGSALHYIKPILNDPLSAIFLVGYQVEGTPGHKLVNEGVFKFKENDTKRHTNFDIDIEAKCIVKYFDFSSHADGPDLQSYIDTIKFQNSSKDVFCVHGDNKSVTTLASNLVGKDYRSVAPEEGESYVI